MTTKIPAELSSTPGIADSSDATAITITSGENIGIGTDTPSQKLHVYNSTLQVGSKTGDTSIQQNTNAIRISAVPNTTTEWGGLQWYREFSDYIGAEIIASRAGTAESDTDLIFKTSTSSANATERMRITHGGLVGIGNTSPSNALTVGSTSVDTSIISVVGSSSGFPQIRFSDDASESGQGRVFYDSANDAMGFSTSQTERMRIDAAGSLFLGTTSGLAKFNMDFSSAFGKVLKYTGSTTTIFPIVFDYGSSTAGSISITSSATSYNTSSDYRLKENVNYEFNALDRVKQLKPARFNFIVDADTTVDGFIAHEVSDIVPEAITGEKDGEEMQGIDQSKLVPLLTKAIQEQQTIIEDLKSRIETLEG